MNRPLTSLLLIFTALQGAACVVHKPDDNLCDPNPCTQANRGTCVEEAGEARCLCDQGFLARPNGTCEAVGPNNCAEHAGDAAEPDDCQTRAQPIASGGPTLQQSIDPIGDYDFFQFTATARHVYSLRVKGEGSLSPRVDVFDQGGAWLAASEAPGTVELFFKARSTSPHFARVSHSPLDPSVATGGYSLTFTSQGQEDHGDFAEDATSISPDPWNSTAPDSNYGRFDFPRDEDWFTFSARRGRGYRLSFDPSRTVPSVAIYMGSDLDRPFFSGQSPTVDFSVPADGTAFIVIFSAPDAPGSYAFNFFEN
jgi:hypothetical protein